MSEGPVPVPTLPPVDPHGYIDLARRVVVGAGITAAVLVVFLLGFIVRGFVGG